MTKKSSYILTLIVSFLLFMRSVPLYLIPFDAEGIRSGISSSVILGPIFFICSVCALFYEITSSYIKNPQKKGMAIMTAFIYADFGFSMLMENTCMDTFLLFILFIANMLGVIICDFMLIKALIRLRRTGENNNAEDD